MNHLMLLPAAVMGYLIGSVPTSVTLSRLLGWNDPRQHGSGHTGARNVGRENGWWAAALVLGLDFGKGLAATLLAATVFDHPYAPAAAAVMAVAGHNWPVWLGFSGGMGLATGMGGVAGIQGLVVLLAAGLLAVIRLLIIKHTPRATIVAALLLVPLTIVLRGSFGLDLPDLILIVGVCLFIAARHMVDWNRVYESKGI